MDKKIEKLLNNQNKIEADGYRKIIKRGGRFPSRT